MAVYFLYKLMSYSFWKVNFFQYTALWDLWGKNTALFFHFADFQTNVSRYGISQNLACERHSSSWDLMETKATGRFILIEILKLI